MERAKREKKMISRNKSIEFKCNANISIFDEIIIARCRIHRSLLHFLAAAIERKKYIWNATQAFPSTHLLYMLDSKWFSSSDKIAHIEVNQI